MCKVTIYMKSGVKFVYHGVNRSTLKIESKQNVVTYLVFAQSKILASIPFWNKCTNLAFMDISSIETITVS